MIQPPIVICTSGSSLLASHIMYVRGVCRYMPNLRSNRPLITAYGLGSKLQILYVGTGVPSMSTKSRPQDSIMYLT